jgi:putative glutamine amidotransferase
MQDEHRDATTLPLLEAAIAKGTPVLCVCRGFQELNVALGGTLHQCLKVLPGRIDHSAPQTDDLAAKFAKAHEVRFRPGGMLHRLAASDQVNVNSLHQQGIDRLANGLIVEATAPDGTIESVCCNEGRGFVLGVQWHPEADFGCDPMSRGIFELFGAAVRGAAMPEMALAAD